MSFFEHYDSQLDFQNLDLGYSGNQNPRELEVEQPIVSDALESLVSESDVRHLEYATRRRQENLSRVDKIPHPRRAPSLAALDVQYSL